jgi:hypothetical protein
MNAGSDAVFDLPRLPHYFPCMTALEERRIKVLLKDAVVEVLEERQDLLRAALQESLEDMAMLKAIQDGEKSRLTSRKRIFQRLARAA